MTETTIETDSLPIKGNSLLHSNAAGLRGSHELLLATAAKHGIAA